MLPFAVSGTPELRYLSDGMVTLLSTDLNGVGSLRSVDPRAVLGIAGQIGPGVADMERGRRVAERVGAGTFIVGNVVEGGGKIRIAATAYRHGTPPNPVASAEVQGPPEQLFELVDVLAGRLLTGLSPGPYEQLTRVAANTTGSLRALKAYLEGERLFRSGEFHPAARAFQQAASEDTTFSLAYYWLSVASWWADDSKAIDSAATLAVRYGGRLPERDRRLFRAWEAFLEGDAIEAERIYRQIVALEPENVEAWLQLGEVLFHSGPRRGRAIGEARPAFERVLFYEPEHASALLHLARIAAAEQRLEELDSLARRVLRLTPTGEWAVEVRALRSFASGDRAEQLRVISDLRTAPEGRVWNTARYVAVATHRLAGAQELVRLLTEPTRATQVRAFGHLALAHIQVALGRPAAAEAELARAEQLDSLPGLEHRALLALLPFLPVERQQLEALRNAVTRRSAPSQPSNLETSHLANLHDGVHAELRAYLLAGLSLRLGDTTSARVQLAELERAKSTPEAATVAGDAAGSIRAQLAVRAGRISDALRSFEDVQRLEARVGLIGGSPFYSQGLERFLYAQLLERAGRRDEAIRWYASFSSNSLFDFVYLAPSHLARGRLEHEAGRTVEAAAHFRAATDLLTSAEPAMDSLARAAAGT